MVKQVFYLSKILQERLTHISEYPLTTIEAPMGYGKTTAIREWLDDGRCTYWWKRVSHESIEFFWEEFITGFLTMNGMEELIPEYFMFFDNQGAISKFEKLIASLRLKNKGAVEHKFLVIDDYHILKSKFMNRIIQCLTDNVIENLHIILTLRSINFEWFDEYKLKGYIFHINKEHLELASADITKYFKMCGYRISNDESLRITRNTEGWISAIYMSMLEYGVSGNFSIEKSIYDLLDKAIYKRLSEDVKEFLLHMCVFDRLSMEQARYIFSKKNTRDILKDLTEANMFVVFDSREKSYSLHSIFREFLLKRLEEKDEEYQKEVYRKSGQWFTITADYFSARECFYKCGDFDGIMETIEKDSSNSYSLFNKKKLDKYVSECPEDVKKKYLYGLLNYGLHKLVQHDIEGLFATVEELGRYIEENQEMDVTSENRLRGEVELLMSLLEINDLDKMIHRFEKAWKLMGQTTRMFFKKNNWTFLSPSVLCIYYRESGKLKETLQKLSDTMPYYHLLTEDHGIGGEDIMEAEYKYMTGAFEDSEVAAHRACFKAENVDGDMIYIGTYHKLKALMIQGKYEEAVKSLRDIEQYKDKGRVYRAIHVSQMCLGQISVYQDLPDILPRMFHDEITEQGRLMFQGKPAYNIIYGRLLLIEERFTELLGLSDYFIQIAEIMPNLLGRIYTYIYMAAAYRKLFRDEEAEFYLMKAMDLGMPDQLYMAFVENCDYIENILQSFSEKKGYVEDSKQILLMYKIYKKSLKGFHKFLNPEKTKLTTREMEVATLAADGNSNSEIAIILFVSPNTVKKALGSIYGKLSINSRALLKDTLKK